MKTEEAIAFDYLKTSGCTSIVYEPDGNVMPDFCVNGSTAVEVRRLNENYFGGVKVEGLEQIDIRLTNAVEAVLEEFIGTESDDTYWLAVHFSRPLEGMNDIKDAIRRALNAFLQSPRETPSPFDITPHLKITILRRGVLDTQRFCGAIWTDYDSGGWLVDLYVKNINHCCAEKSAKAIKRAGKYTEWWLVLVDALIGIAPREMMEVICGVSKTAPWDRIIVVSATTKTMTFEI